MKRRAFNRHNEDFNYWPSFVDIMTTISLVFFFLMIICIVLTYKKYEEYAASNKTYQELKEEKERLQEEIAKSKANIDNIGAHRDQLYKNITDRLKSKLGDNISYADGKIEIKSDVLFDSGSSTLSLEGKQLAIQVSEAFYELLQEKEYNSKIESIEIRGHTDNVGLGEYNRQLSTERAVSFVNEMLRDGTKYEAFANKFKASGMSKYQPQSGSLTNQSDSDKARNRRIEIHIKFVDDDIAEVIKKLQNSSQK